MLFIIIFGTLTFVPYNNVEKRRRSTYRGVVFAGASFSLRSRSISSRQASRSIFISSNLVVFKSLCSLLANKHTTISGLLPRACIVDPVWLVCVCGMPFYMFLVFHNQAGISTVAQNSVISWKITLMLMLTLTQLTNF